MSFSYPQDPPQDPNESIPNLLKQMGIDSESDEEKNSMAIYNELVSAALQEKKRGGQSINNDGRNNTQRKTFPHEIFGITDEEITGIVNCSKEDDIKDDIKRYQCGINNKYRKMSLWVHPDRVKDKVKGEDARAFCMLKALKNYFFNIDNLKKYQTLRNSHEEPAQVPCIIAHVNQLDPEARAEFARGFVSRYYDNDDDDDEDCMCFSTLGKYSVLLGVPVFGPWTASIIAANTFNIPSPIFASAFIGGAAALPYLLVLGPMALIGLAAFGFFTGHYKLSMGAGMAGVILGIATIAFLASNPVGWVFGLSSLIIAGGFGFYSLVASDCFSQHYKPAMAVGMAMGLVGGLLMLASNSVGWAIGLGLIIVGVGMCLAALQKGYKDYKRFQPGKAGFFSQHAKNQPQLNNKKNNKKNNNNDNQDIYTHNM